MNSILVNRVYDLDGNWYAPKEHLESYQSVLHVELIDTSSSAEDWDGLLFQLVNGIVYAIPFSQENDYPCRGFTLYTGDVCAKFKHSEFNEEVKRVFIEEYCSVNYVIN